MIKRIVEMQNVNGHIDKMKTTNILKLMVVFWLILLMQVRFNKNARKTVFKIMYILGGIVTVFGAVGSTGVLCYKEWRRKKNTQQL
jgi:hypothetical protein